MRSRFGRGLDWPVSYDELRPFYDEIQQEVGISGDAGEEVWRPPGLPYPMPPRKVFKQATLIAGGFAKLRWRSTGSIPYGGHPACRYDGWCDAGCSILALANPLAVYLPQARKAGAEIVHNACVTRILTGSSGDRAAGVEYYNLAGQRQVRQARMVIVAAYAFQTPRILFNSATNKLPAGLANSRGLLGRYMMTHASSIVYGIFKEIPRIISALLVANCCARKTTKRDARRGYINSSQWLIANVTTRKDRYGFPLASMTHDFGADDIKCYEAGMQQRLSVMKAVGAYQAWHGGRVRMHAMGGALMGSDPRTSVTNSYGQTHDVANLFVEGPSLFPTSGAVNPIFTIHALTLRASKYILGNWSILT